MRLRILIFYASLCLSAMLWCGCDEDDVVMTPQPQPTGGPFFHQIYSASSSDGLNWSFDNRMLLDHASVPVAIATPEGKLRIYYVDAAQTPVMKFQ